MRRLLMRNNVRQTVCGGPRRFDAERMVVVRGSGGPLVDFLCITFFVIPMVLGAAFWVMYTSYLVVSGRKEIWRWLKENRVFAGAISLLTLLLVAWLYDITGGLLLAALVLSLMAAAAAVSAYVSRQKALYWVAIGIVVLSVWAARTGASYRAEKSLDERMQSTESAKQLSTSDANDPPSVPSGGLTETELESEPAYSDERWPTTSPELLAIPEADRWYSSRTKVGSVGTIAGPVASVVPLGNRVMINIGEDYPNPDRAQVVIWREDVSEFRDLLSAIDHGGAWISIRGRISSYDGVAEIDVGDSRVEYTWWTNVR